MSKFTGLMAAPFTPLDEKRQLRLDRIPEYVERLITDGVRGIFVCGSNGEGPNMSSEERMLTAAAFTEAAEGRLKVFVHVGHASIVESQKLAEHAVKIGADAISAVSAFYFKPESEQNLVDALAEIAGAAPELPFYYYHIPRLTGVRLDILKFVQLAEAAIPNFAGTKYTATTLHEYQQCLNHNDGKSDMLFGFDELLLPALAVGAKGLVGSTYNFAAPLYYEVIDAFERKDIPLAQEKMLFLIQMIKVFLQFPAISAQKAIMKRLGLDLGPCIHPLVTLTSEQESSLYRQLDELGFFEVLERSKSGGAEVVI